MEEAHARELGAYQDLKKALETLLQEREEEIEGLKCTVEDMKVSSALDPVVTPVVDTEAIGLTLEVEQGQQIRRLGVAATSTGVSTSGDLTGAGAAVGTGKVAVGSADVARTSSRSNAADTACSVSV